MDKDKDKKNTIITLNSNEMIIYNTNALLSHNDKTGRVDNTIDNYRLILLNDDTLYNKYQYNLFTRELEYINDDKIPVRWGEDDNSIFLNYIELNYHISDEKKFKHGMNIAKHSKAYHPLKDLIESIQWDGTPRIDNFLKDVLKGKEDEKYLKEVSRMLFYGGISRLYVPSIKFDYMIVLSGRQGIGKSTIVQWLALNSKYYKEITTIKDKEGVECLIGGWICEFSELMAFRGNNQQESLKAFITRPSDDKRLAYEQGVQIRPRQCIFIGTTNTTDYLSDLTGNRRFLPVTLDLQVGELFDNEKYVKDYIRQCWAEALALFKDGKTYLTLPKDVVEFATKYQGETLVDDPQLALVEDYLDSKNVGDYVCTLSIMCEALHKLQTDVNKADSKLVSMWMSNEDCWEKQDVKHSFDNYKRQRCWKKVKDIKRDSED